MSIGPDRQRIERLIAAFSAAFEEGTTARTGEMTGAIELGRAQAPAQDVSGDIELARAPARTGDVAGAIELGRAAARTGNITGAIELARAPTCVNLIGDNTEYNEGFVLPVAIGLETWIAFRRRRDGLVRTAASAAGKRGSFWIDAVAPPAPLVAASDASAAWPDYVAGTAWSLREAGLPIRGFDGVIDSTIPPGIGLSANAPLELVSGLALLSGSSVLAGPALAALAQRAERDYLGVAGGIVDQFAGAAGRAGRALLLDCRSLESRTVALPWGLQVVVCDTGSSGTSNRDAELARRAECGRAVALLAERVPWVSSLRDVDTALLHRYRGLLPEVVARRAEHVIAENARVLAAAPAMESADLDGLGRLFSESHSSLRDLYQAGTPALDAMVEVALAVPGVVAARMAGGTAGGGRGRCTVNLVLSEAVPALVAAVENEYRRRTGLAGVAYPVAIVDGAGSILI